MKRSRKICGVLSIGVCLAVFLSAAGIGCAKELKTLKISYFPIIDLLQYYVASEKGFFEEEGLKIEAQATPGGAVAQTLVESGSIDLGYGAVIPLSQAVVKGFDFEVIAPGNFMDSSTRTRRLCSVVVKKDSPFRSVKDLAGKKIGVNALNGLNHLSILAISDFHGVDLKSLKFVEVSFPMQPAALREQAVDATSMVEPFITISEGEGVTRELFNGFFPPELIDRYMVGLWFAKRATVEKKKDEIAGFLRAINKATDFISKNPDQLPEIIAKHTKLELPLVRKVTQPAFFTQLYKKDIQAQIDLGVKYGFISRTVDARQIVTDLIPLK